MSVQSISNRFSLVILDSTLQNVHIGIELVETSGTRACKYLQPLLLCFFLSAYYSIYLKISFKSRVSSIEILTNKDKIHGAGGDFNSVNIKYVDT